MGKNQHVVKNDDQWGVRGEGKAIDYAKSVAQNQRSEVLIHGKDGKIRERNSYGNDPFPPRG